MVFSYLHRLTIILHDNRKVNREVLAGGPYSTASSGHALMHS